MRNRHLWTYRAILSAIVVILLAGALAFALLENHSQRSAIRTQRKQIRALDEQVVSLDRSRLWEDKSLPYLREICEDIDRRSEESGLDWIVCARKYVREAFRYADTRKYDTPGDLKAIYRYYNDPEHPKARFDCQPACRALASILHYKGFRSRLIGFLTDDFDYVASHACLEVFNPKTGRWELHDVLYDLHFLDRQTGEVLAATDLVFGPMDRVVPTNGTVKGWKKAAGIYGNGIKLRDHYYEVLAYNHPTRKCFVLVNTSRVDLNKRFPGNDNQTMLEFINRVYVQPPILGLPDGKYLTLPVHEHKPQR